MPSSSYGSGKTTIRVNEVILELEALDPISLSTDGYVQNISTYVLATGTGNIVVSPGVTLEQYPIDFLGRNVSGWGESYAQNFIDISRNFAASLAPENPFVGLTWYDTDDKQLRVWDGTAWDLINRTYDNARHTQGIASSIWTVNHGLDLPAPFIAFAQFFVIRDDIPRLILPIDVTFVSANQLTADFSNAEIGYVLVRK